MAKEDLGRLIALSTAGINEELAVHGIGVEHVEELMVRLEMRLLTDGHRLAFGGTMGVADHDLTKHLIYTAQRWGDEDSARKIDITRPDTWPLVNYSAWPNYTRITAEQRAKLVGICHFVDIDPPLVSKPELATVTAPERIKRLGADALTAMREYSTKNTHLRVVWGGRIAGSTGWMAGILEEVVCSLEMGKPVLVLGGFGGCARLIADFLKDKAAPWDERLGLAACAEKVRDESLTVKERDQLNQRMQLGKELLADFRSAIHTKDKVNGISTSLIRHALYEESARAAINIAASAVVEIQGL